jgi:uncharacterized protein
MSISRRLFMEGLPISAAAWQQALAAQKDPRSGMPMRQLGATGEKVTQLAFGCGSRFLLYKDEDEADRVVNKAIDLGIRYLDTAYGYGAGASETRIGRIMKTRRKEVFLATKVDSRDPDQAQRIIEGSLQRLQTSQFDLLHIHSLQGPDDLAKIEQKGGLIDILYRMREQKITRFIGVTCHTDPAVLRTALERHDFNCTQMALNAARIGMAAASSNPAKGSFETLALPVAVKKKMGVIAMKIFAQDKLKDKAAADKLMSYGLSLPVSAIVVGMPTLEYLEQNVATARNFKPLAPAEMQQLGEELSSQYKAAIDQYFADHADA